MADRYWVGGTANWDGTAGTKWATTSGGTGGASVPTAADDVYFDAASGAVTITAQTATPVCRNFNATGFTGTFVLTGVNFVPSGSVTFSAGMTFTPGSNSIVTNAGNGSFTFTTAGKTMPAVFFDAVSPFTVTYTLQDAFTSSSAITVIRGTLNTNNFNVTATQLSSSNTNTRTINLGSSTVTLTSSANIIVNFSTNTNLTFNAGTSTISASGTTTIISGGGAAATGVTFNNVSFTATSATTHQIQGINTFNNITVTAPSAAGVTQFTFDSRQTINGTLSTTGTAGNRRVWFRSSTYGIAQTLTINSAPSLTDADFRDIYVIGTATPISGTRIGDLRGIRGITASTPKTVYWNLAAGGNWSANAWAASSGGGVSTDNFPLAQDTAVIGNTGLNTSATVTLDSAIVNISGINMSTRTNAMTLSLGTNINIYGDLTCGSGTTYSSSTTLTFIGRNTQTITSAGKTLGIITVDSYGGTVQLADALNIGSNALTVTNGTFDTKNYNVTAGSLSSNNSNVRTITLGSSTVTLSSTLAVVLTTSTNLTFNAGTSQITASNIGGDATVLNSGGLQFYNFTVTTLATPLITITGSNTFNNLTLSAPASAGLQQYIFAANQTITGTLACAGATAVRRVFVRSSVLGTARTLTVNSLSATDCDFRDITIAGAAAGSSPTRAGNCGGNSGITFPAAKTVYWNLAGNQSTTATAWATGSGGTPDINNFPLAQDTAVFDNTGSVTGTITMTANMNVGTFDMSARTSAMTLSPTTSSIYGDWKNGTGVTMGVSGGAMTFCGRSTQTITSNGVTIGIGITVDCLSGTVQLADALSLESGRTLTLTSGTFDAVTYNATTGLFATSTASTKTLKMGSGTWTLSGTGTVWDASASNTTLLKSTANIVLSNTSTSARTFNTGGLSYNKLTIGGTTGTSTLTIAQNGQFTELASTKTVAHTIDFGSTTQTFGKWTVTGTAGNVVTLSGTGTSHVLAGAATSGIDYLAMGSIGFAATSPGEFYAGANSTGTAGAPVFRTAPPAARTLYWVGGTGNWSSTTKWSTSSGGGSGAAVPTSLDNVIFDAASNATAYTATIDATSRCNQLTIAGPTSGNVTLAGSSTLICHGNITLPATGLTRTFTGPLVLSGSVTGDTLTTNGVALASIITVNGVGCEWTLGSALNNGASSITITNGNLLLSTYNLTLGSISSNNGNSRTINFGSGTVTFQGNNLDFGTSVTNRETLTFVAGTSQLTCNQSTHTINGNNKTFYNVSFTDSAKATITINGENTFNNLSFTGRTSAGISTISLSANQTVTGTLTLSAGTNATMRHFVRSDTIGTTRTITAAAVNLTDADFRDITIAGAAAPVSGTRLGDCKGNSGITFPAAKTVYWVQGSGVISSNNGFATASGGLGSTNNFVLAQDTAVFDNSSGVSGFTVTIDADYNIGTIDMSARTSNTMTLATGTNTPTIYGNWINGTGTTLTGTGVMTFAGRGSQTITSAGRTFTQGFTINSPGGSVTLQDAFTTSLSATTALTLTSGTFDANGFNVTLSGTASAFGGSGSQVRTVAIGSGTWTIAGGPWSTNPSTNCTITGTGTISLTSATAKSFAGGDASYTNITVNQGGAGTLNITGNNTLKDITNTYKGTGATTINIGTTTQRVSQWTGAGEAGRLLTVQGSSASSPGTLILSSGTVNVDYLTITGVRAYNLSTTWYAGANSTNNGSLGWIFSAAPAAASTGNFFLFFNPF